MSTDVVVVGCGPVGVMAALRCAQHGLSVTAIDRDLDIYPLPRAIAMDDEIQRLFQRAGLIDELRTVSSPMKGAEFVDAQGERLTGIELPDGFVGGLGHPVSVAFEQPAVEAFLREAAAAAGVEFRLGVHATAVVDDGASVALSLRSDDGDEVLRSWWLIGADGASSTIRRLLEVPFDDQGFDQPWLVVDTTQLDPDLELPMLATQVCDPARVVTVIPGHGTRRRWEFQLADHETREEMLEPARIAELLEPWATTEQVRLDRAAVYRFHALVAARFRVGNVFLAGDAAHQMPPFNGQGMCTGMRDAENLAWKLAMVAAGNAGEALLDTYDEERRPHAKGQVLHSADAGRLIDALTAGEDVSTAAGYGGSRPFPHLESGVLVAGHPAVGHQLPQPLVDGSWFDEQLGGGFVVLAADSFEFDEAAMESVARIGASVVRVDPVHFPFVLDTRSVAVVRPDLHVAAVGDDLAAIVDELADRMGLVADGRPV